MVLEFGPDIRQIERFDVVEEQNAMRIAHRYAGDVVCDAADDQRAINNLAVGIDGNLTPLENRLAHIDFDELTNDPRSNDTREGFDFQFFFPGQTMLVNVFRETANAVT